MDLGGLQCWYEGVSTEGGGGHHVRGRGVGFSPSDVLICLKIGFDFAVFGPASEASRVFLRRRCVFLDQKVTKDSKSDKSVEQKKTKKRLICCRARREDSKNAKKLHLRSRGGEKLHRVCKIFDFPTHMMSAPPLRGYPFVGTPPPLAPCSIPPPSWTHP